MGANMQTNRLTLITIRLTPAGRSENSKYKYIRLRRLTYIHTCRSYVHTSRDHVFGSHSVIVVNVVAVVARWPIRPILGFWGGKVHKNGIFPALDADELPCKI